LTSQVSAMARVSRKLSSKRRDSRDSLEVLRRSAGKGCCCPNCRLENEFARRRSDAPSLAVKEFAPQLRVPDLAGREASSRQAVPVDREPTCFPSGVHLPPAPVPSEEAVPFCTRLTTPRGGGDIVSSGRSLPPPPLLLLLLEKEAAKEMEAMALPVQAESQEVCPAQSDAVSVQAQQASRTPSLVSVQTEEASKALSHVSVQAEEVLRPQTDAAVQVEEASKALSHVSVQAEEVLRPQTDAAVQVEEASKALSHVSVQAEEVLRPQTDAAVQVEEVAALSMETDQEMDQREHTAAEESPPLAASPASSSSSSCPHEAPSELCGVAEWSRSPGGRKRVNAAPWSEQTPVYRPEDHSEVQSTDVPSEPWLRDFRLPTPEADLSRAWTGKEVKRPEYVNLISLTSKMKKQAAQRRAASAPRNVSSDAVQQPWREAVIPMQQDRPIPRVRQGRRYSETERLRSAMRLLPRRRSREDAVTQATRWPH